MPRVIGDGEILAMWVPTIANTSAPTVAEISAGTDITAFLGSLDTPLDGDKPDASDLSTAFNKNVAGTFGGGVTGEMWRDDTTDTAWTTFVRGTTGYLVLRRFGGSTVAIALADNVEVWHLRVVTRSPATLDRGSVQAFSVDYATVDEPVLNAVVA